jgi:hypothetical protein
MDAALSGWKVPLAGLVVAASAALLHLGGLASEPAAAAVIVLCVAVVAALHLAARALDPTRDGWSRALAGVAAALTAVATAFPSVRTVLPGEALLQGELRQRGDQVTVPAGLSGAVRLLVTGALPDRGEPWVSFRIAGTDPPVEGRLARTFAYARIGRGGRRRVASDHAADFHDARIAPGTRALELEQVQGSLDAPLRVAAYRQPLPIPGGPWGLALAALALAALAEARLARPSALAVPAGMALAFGLLVTYDATPSSAVGPAVGSLLLGAIAGSLAGWFAGALARRLVPPGRRGAIGGRGAAPA